VNNLEKLTKRLNVELPYNDIDSSMKVDVKLPQNGPRTRKLSSHRFVISDFLT